MTGKECPNCGHDLRGGHSKHCIHSEGFEYRKQIADLERQLAEAQKALKWIRAKYGALAAGLLSKQALGEKLAENEEALLREAFDRVGGLEE